MAEAACSVVGCSSLIGKKGARGWCSMHYQRALSTGDPRGRRCETCSGYLAEKIEGNVGRRRYCSLACTPRCPVVGCADAIRKNGLCDSHAHQKRVTGAASPFSRKWASAGGHCVVCGALVTGRRATCSPACRTMKSRSPDRPTHTACSLCGEGINLLLPSLGSRSGRRRRFTSAICEACTRKHVRPALTVQELVARDGDDCTICCHIVDLAIAWPDRLSPSVDHVMPLAKGGSEQPENLALAHLGCNCAKGDRMLC